jgi:hypothetical protein
MSDIFDELAKKHKQDGDIFDQLARQQAPQEPSFLDNIGVTGAIKTVQSGIDTAGKAISETVKHPLEATHAGLSKLAAGAVGNIDQIANTALALDQPQRPGDVLQAASKIATGGAGLLARGGNMLAGRNPDAPYDLAHSDLVSPGVDARMAQAQNPNAAEVGQFAGGLLPWLYSGAVSAPAKLLPAVLSGAAQGLGFGTTGDISARYQQGLPQDIPASIQAGLPAAWIGGSLGGISHASHGKGKSAPAPEELTPLDLVKIDASEIPKQLPMQNGMPVRGNLFDEPNVKIQNELADYMMNPNSHRPTPANLPGARKLFAEETDAARPVANPELVRAHQEVDKFFRQKPAVDPQTAIIQTQIDELMSPKAHAKRALQAHLETEAKLKELAAETEAETQASKLQTVEAQQRLAQELQAEKTASKAKEAQVEQQLNAERIALQAREMAKPVPPDLFNDQGVPVSTEVPPNLFSDQTLPPAKLVPPNLFQAETQGAEGAKPIAPPSQAPFEPVAPTAPKPPVAPAQSPLEQQLAASIEAQKIKQTGTPAPVEPVKTPTKNTYVEEYPIPEAHADVEGAVKPKWKPPRPDLNLEGADNYQRTGAASNFIRAGFKRISQMDSELGKMYNESMTDWKSKGGKKLSEGQIPIADSISAHLKTQFDEALNKVLLSEGVEGGKAWMQRISQETDRFLKDESGSMSSAFESGTLLGDMLDSAGKALEKSAPGTLQSIQNATHGEDGRLFSRLGGLETVTDAIKRYDKPFSEMRDNFRSKLKQIMAGSEDFTTEGQINARNTALRMDKTHEILTSPELKDLSQSQRQTLYNAKQIFDTYVNQHLKPQIDKLEQEGIASGLSGKYRYRRMLEQDLEDLRPSAGSENYQWLREARGGLHRSIFRGNWHTGWLHATEGTMAGVTHDPVAWTKTQGALIKTYTEAATGKANAVYDFLTSHHGAPEMDLISDTDLPGAKTSFASNPVGSVITGAAKLNSKFSDSVVKTLESIKPGNVKVGKTFIDVARAQIPEKLKMQTLNLMTLIRHADMLEYPGGYEGLAKDYMAQARGKEIPGNRAMLLDKARINMFQDMNRIVLDAPQGWAEKTVFQRGIPFTQRGARKFSAEIGSLMFPFTRSVLQQSRMVASYADDAVSAIAAGDLKKAGYAASSLTGFLGLTAVAAGSAALPPQIEAMKDSDSEDIRDAYQVIKQNVEFLHELSHNPVTIDHLKWKPTLLDIMDHAGESNFANSIQEATKRAFDPKANDRQKMRAYLMMASLARLDNIGGLIGTNQAAALYKVLENSQTGTDQQFVFKDRKPVAHANFDTDLGQGLQEYFTIGTPNEKAQWKQQAGDQYDWENRQNTPWIKGVYQRSWNMAKRDE